MVTVIIVVLIFWILGAAILTISACMISSRISQAEELSGNSTVEMFSLHVIKRMGENEPKPIESQPNHLGYQASFGKG